MPLLLVVLLLVMVSSNTIAAAPQAAPTRVGAGDLYLALGDSLGVGLLSSAPDTRGYVAQFHALLERSAGRTIQLQNVSISGETTGTLVVGGQLLAATQAIKSATARGWRVSPITVDIGGNDLRALQGTDDRAREAGLVEFRANLGRIFDALIAATTQNGARTADILTMTVYNPYGGDPQIKGSDAWWVVRFNTVITEEAAKRDIPVAAVYDRFLGHEKELSWVPLDFHANNRGHRAIAEEFWRVAGYDVAPPTLEIVEPAAGALNRAVPTIKVRAADNLGVNSVAFQIDGQPLPVPVFANDLGLWIGYWDARTATVGKHTLTVIARDAAGNETKNTVAITR